MPLLDYTFKFTDTGVVLNDDSLSYPFVDIDRVGGLDSAPFRETVRDHEGANGGFLDAEFEKGRDIALEGTAYCASGSEEAFLDSLKSNFAPGTILNPFYFKAPGVTERVLYCKSRGVRYDWDQARRTGCTPIQFLLYAEDPRIYTNSLNSTVINFGGFATTGFGFVSIFDSYSRTLTDSWGSADTGDAWTNSGTAADYDIASGVGTHTLTSTNVPRVSRVGTGFTDTDVKVVVSCAVSPTTGAAAQGAVMYRYQDDNNYLFTDLRFQTTGNAELVIGQRVAGAETNLTNVNLGAYTANQRWILRAVCVGTNVQAMAWVEGTTVPSTWQATAGSMPITSSGPVGVRSVRTTSNTNSNLVISFDNFNYVGGFGFDLGFGTSIPVTGGQVTVGGNRPTPPVFTIAGPVVDPRIINDTYSKSLNFSITLGVSDLLVIDVAARTVTLNGSTNRRNALTTMDWFELQPGNTFLRLGGSSGSGTLTVQYRDAWR